MENYVMEVKGSGHPDTLADKYADIVVEEIQKNDGSIHVNADNSTLKSGNFPKLTFGGNVSYDFESNPYDHLTKAMYSAKRAVISEFKKKFNNAVIEFNLDFAINRNNLEYSTTKELMGDTSYVTAFYPLNSWETVVTKLAGVLNKESEQDGTHIGSDFKLLLKVVDGKSTLLISQCFVKDVEKLKTFNSAQELDEHKTKLRENYYDFIAPYTHGIDEVIVNADEEEFGFFWNKFGSSVFNNDCGSVGRGNDFYGFTSPHRPSNNEAGHGKAYYHPASRLFNTAYQKAVEKYNETGKPVQVTAVSMIGRPNSEVEYIYN